MNSSASNISYVYTTSSQTNSSQSSPKGSAFSLLPPTMAGTPRSAIPPMDSSSLSAFRILYLSQHTIDSHHNVDSLQPLQLSPLIPIPKEEVTAEPTTTVSTLHVSVLFLTLPSLSSFQSSIPPSLTGSHMDNTLTFSPAPIQTSTPVYRSLPSFSLDQPSQAVIPHIFQPTALQLVEVLGQQFSLLDSAVPRFHTFLQKISHLTILDIQRLLNDFVSRANRNTQIPPQQMDWLELLSGITMDTAQLQAMAESAAVQALPDHAASQDDAWSGKAADDFNLSGQTLTRCQLHEFLQPPQETDVPEFVMNSQGIIMEEALEPDLTYVFHGNNVNWQLLQSSIHIPDRIMQTFCVHISLSKIKPVVYKKPVKPQSQ